MRDKLSSALSPLICPLRHERTARHRSCGLAVGVDRLGLSLMYSSTTAILAAVAEGSTTMQREFLVSGFGPTGVPSNPAFLCILDRVLLRRTTLPFGGQRTINPFRTAAPFWGQSIQISSGLSQVIHMRCVYRQYYGGP